MKNEAHLDNCRIYHNVVIGEVVVHQRSFNKVRHRVCEIIRGYIANSQWTISFFWVIPTGILGIKSIKTISPIPVITEI